MIKKILLCLLVFVCAHSAATAQFTSMNITGATTSYEGFESPIKTRYTINLTGTIPPKYYFDVQVQGGTLTAYDLTPVNTRPDAGGGGIRPMYVQVRWDCGVTNGTITVTETKSGLTTSINVYIKSFFNIPPSDYCSQTVTPKQNLHLGDVPSLLSVTYCSQTCLDNLNATYQWQVGDVPVGVFPQVPPNGFNDIVIGIMPGEPSPWQPTYQPMAVRYNCIKAYRRKTTFYYNKQLYVFYSTPAVISTFDYLDGGKISWTESSNTGSPAVHETPATGGLCDGFNYGYTWELSTDNANWSVIGTGENFPTLLQLPATCFIRRKVDCNGETQYSNTLYMEPLKPGAIYGGGNIPFNTLPSVMQDAASGGVCGVNDYVYTWERSFNNGAWVQFGTGINYPANAIIIGSCKVRRKVHCMFEDAYSNELPFIMLPYTSPNAENLNYVRTNDIVIPGIQSWEQADMLPTGDKLQSTTYLDGFGRPIQSVTKQGSFIPSAVGQGAENNISNYQDLVAYTQYDGLGRADKGFLPYATTTNLGFFKTNAAAEQQSFNNQKYGEPANSVYTYSQNTYDGSPLNRVTNVKLPGAALNSDVNYQGISSDYDFNKQTENVRVWDIGFNAGDVPVNNGIYPDSKLLKSITTDEKGKRIITYTDLGGHVILKRVQETDNAIYPPTGDDIGWLSTYYVYDDFGRLRYTITPKAVRSLMVQSTSNWVFYDALKKGLCFYQEYDNRGRVTVKHSPDGGEVWLVYDNRDRLVLSQDENQRNRAGLNPAKANQWSFSLYDENDRVLTTGLMNDSRNRNDMQAFVDGLAPQNQQVQIYTGTYETITAYNPVIINANAADVFINSASYYDDYSKAPANQTPVNLTASDFAPTTNKYVEQPAVSMIRMRGAATVSKVRKLTANYDNESSNATQFLTSTTYYDAKGRVVQSYSDNVKGGVDASAVLYDFAGKVLCTRGKHNMPNNDFDNLLVITKNDYDLLGRATRLWKLYTKNSADISNPAKYKKLSEIKLDELGRGKTKTIGDDPQNPGTALETMDFSYNMQGKLTGVNKDYALANAAGSMNNQWARRFGFYLGYENADNNFANKQYNGSITGVTWRSQGDNTQRKYDYEYDNINRFKAANFTQKDGGTSGAWGTALVDLSASVSGYDANGNIMGMVQKGIVPGTNGGVILDNLNYVYFPNSNRLRNVSDGASVAVSGKQGDFKDYATVTDYGYDANGNLTYDKNKNIIDVASNITDNSPKAGINSNFLDLPQTITIKDKSKTEYTYDASGNKLAKTVTQLTPNAPAPVTTWYIGGFVYEETGAKTTLQYILNEEGKLRITDVTPVTTPAGVIQVGITANVDFGLGAKWGVWDYYLKDNLGNTRMVLTEEGQMQVMKCTMEVSPPALKAEEEANFGNANKNEVDLTRTLDIVPGWNSNKTRASKLQPAVGAGTAIGPNVILKVMAGDIINARADYYYQAATPQQQNTNLLDNIVQSLLGSISGSTSVNSGVKAGIDLSYLQGSNTPIQPFLKDYHPATTGNQPRAYLNYIFFDEQFRYVPDCSGAKMVVAAGDGQPQLVPPIPKATHNGYVYVYLSNETPNIPVYFDNFQVSQIRGPIVEDNAYYPFGLKIQGISAKAAGKIKAKEGYQGNYNEQDEETGYNEFDLRFYDPQIGRWIQVDPYGEFASGYVGMGDDPVNNVDQDGGGVGDPVPTTLPEYVVVSTIKRASTVLQPSLVPHVVTLAINTYLSYTAINNNGTTTSTFLIPATNNPAQSINFNGQTYVASGSYNEEITKTEWVVKPEDPVVSVQRHLDEISKQCPSCIWREAIPYEKQVIAATDMFGDGHIGPREDVESNIQGVRANYINMLGDNIRNGPAAAAGQMLFGDKGNIIGSGVDGVITSLGGVRGGDQSTRFFGQQEQNIPVASRALFSGKNTEQMALADGYQTLGQTRAALNLQNLIESRGLSWREAEPMWGRLSRAWVNGIPNGSKIPVYLNNVRPNSVFQTYELTPARSKNLSLINKLKF